MRWISLVIATLCFANCTATAQQPNRSEQPLLRETIREYGQHVVQSQPVPVVVTQYRESPVYRDVVRYAAPIVYAPAPVPVGYRVGVLGLRQDVIYSDGSRVRYRR